MVVYVALSALGLYKMKAASAFASLEFILGAGAYIASFLIWIYLLKTNPLSYIFPVAAGALILATSLLGIVQLDEQLSLSKLAGTLLIILGIFLLTLDQQA